MKDDYSRISLLSMSKAATLLGIGKQTLNKLINSGRIGVVVINQKSKIAYHELERFIAENTLYQSTTSGEIPFSDEVSISTTKKSVEYDSTELFNRLKGELLYG
jgi:excisionase family DNA binding protein